MEKRESYETGTMDLNHARTMMWSSAPDEENYWKVCEKSLFFLLTCPRKRAVQCNKI